jgi:hypothetical protein
VTGDVREVGVRRMKVDVGFESEELPGRGSDCEDPSGSSRLGVFKGEWATLVASSVECVEVSGPRDFCVFFKLSN